MNSIQQIIETLELQPHPEGGYFRESYRSTGVIPRENLSEQYSGDRNYATSIYFLLTSDSFSAFHKIHQDEQWHFYDGTPIHLHMISPEGNYSEISIGRNLGLGQLPQFTVPGGYWFASEVKHPNSYALAGCTVSPGFDFADFNLPERRELLALFPQHSEIIHRLTR
ncbi:MAG: cupin domain-containing protein [Bacteroidota bacterium]